MATSCQFLRGNKKNRRDAALKQADRGAGKIPHGRQTWDLKRLLKNAPLRTGERSRRSATLQFQGRRHRISGWRDTLRRVRVFFNGL
jgi:hypothetical protein